MSSAALRPVARDAGPSGDLDIWRVDLTRPCDPSTLSVDEVDRVRRSRHPESRRRFAGGRVAARSLLADRLGRDAQELRFDPTCGQCGGAHGKPRLVDPGRPLSWNLSNCGDVAVIAICESGEVGVDVEHVDAARDPVTLAERFFAPDERHRITALPAPARRREFLRCWTAKEAFLKARGEGIALGMDWFSVRPNGTFALPDEPHEETRWWLSHVALEPELLVACAVRRHSVAASELSGRSTGVLACP